MTPAGRKIYVLDTNVLLENPDALYEFADNEVWVPITCIEEVDKFKRDQTSVGRAARQLSRNLDRLREQGRLADGVPTEHGGLVRVVLTGDALKLLPEGAPDAQLNDHKILAVAWKAMRDHPAMPVVLLSRDTNLRIKADVLGITCVDYKPDRNVRIEELYAGVMRVQVAGDVIDRLFAERELDPAEAGDVELYPNQYVHFIDERSENHTGIGRFDVRRHRIVPLALPAGAVWGVRPRNLEQSIALDLLLNDAVQLVTLVGKAGTGKTLLAIAAGLKCALDERLYKRLLVSRPVFPMGRDLGYLPGELNEKLKPWMQPIFDNLEFLLGNPERESKNSGGGYGELIRQGMIEVEPLTYIRGRSIPKQYFVVDEAQNLTQHEVKTIISRAGEGTKVVLTGDPYQIDQPYLDSVNNGLTHAVERMKGSTLAGHVTLTKGERSALAQAAADLL